MYKWLENAEGDAEIVVKVTRNGIQMLNESTRMEAFLDIASLYGECGIHMDFKLFGEAI